MQWLADKDWGIYAMRGERATIHIFSLLYLPKWSITQLIPTVSIWLRGLRYLVGTLKAFHVPNVPNG